MPIYEYRCKQGHTFDVLQRFSDDPITECEVCGEPVERVFHPAAIHFKGSGFYNTDYGTKKRAAEKAKKADKKSSAQSSKTSDSKSSNSKPNGSSASGSSAVGAASSSAGG